MARLGIIARADKTGLGNQTRAFIRMLNPDKILVIDSTPFNGNGQDFSFFEGKNIQKIRGFPNERDIRTFLNGLDVVFSCETFYNNHFTNIARQMGVKTVLQPNWEFFDWNIRGYSDSYRLPDLLLIPSQWHQDDFSKFDTRVIYLPPPIFLDDYNEIRSENLPAKREVPRFLHNAGKIAHLDRNGTKAVLEAMQKVKGDFELVVKTQGEPNEYLKTNDPRISFDYSNPDDVREMYRSYDAMVLPRRYAGLCLPMIEALASGLPVIMTDVSPNNQQLPKDWLASAELTESFMARSKIDVYSVNTDDLAKKVEWMIKHLEKEKEKAYNIIYKYSDEVLLPVYLEYFMGLTDE